MSNAPVSPPPPAGWYPDGINGQRYWDGTAWTEHRAPATTAVATGPKNSTATAAFVFAILTIVFGATIIGAFLAIITAIIGFIMGISGFKASAKLQDRGRGLSIAAFIICGAVLVIVVMAYIVYFSTPH